jgi:hypothetical protein
MAERDSLREMNDELKCAQVASPGMSLGDQMGEVGSASQRGIEMMSVPPEIK